MRFGGFSEASRTEAMMRALKAQPVFGQGGSMVEPRNESILHFAGNRRFPGQESITDNYFRAVSKETRVHTKPTGSDMVAALFGRVRLTVRHEVDFTRLALLVRESLPFLDAERRYANLRWHDVAVLWVMLRAFPEGSEEMDFAMGHSQNLARLDPAYAGYISKYFISFSSES